MYYVAEALIRWIAPILSFTAEEAWQHMPGTRDKSVFLQEWYKTLDQFNNLGQVLKSDWDGIRECKEQISKELEELRNDKQIGSSLDAEVKIWKAPEYLKKIKNDELRFVFITSYADILEGEPPKTAMRITNTNGENFFVEVKKSDYEKCIRCWHYREDVGTNTEHSELCGRCVSNLPDGEGEIRKYA